MKIRNTAAFAAVFVGIWPVAGAGAGGAEPIRIDSVLLELVEQVDVPARDQGTIQLLAVREGDPVVGGDVLVELEKEECLLDVERAETEAEIAQAEAKNDVDVRFARKSLEVAEAELRRATDSVEEYPKSVSQTELDHLRLTVERNQLAIEQAEHQMRVASLTAKLKENQLKTARQRLERLTIRAPVEGLVAQVYRRAGEWVEPGQQVIRILRIDPLRAEGFVDAGLVDGLNVGDPVTISLEMGAGRAKEVPGHLVLISPEIDPVNGQVRLWAEVANPQRALRPGLRGTMAVLPSGSDD